MIVKEQPTAFGLFLLMHGSIIPHIYGKIIFVTLLTALVTYLDNYVAELPRISMAAMGVFGVALSLFLGFRNNAAFDRWWEARKQWGAIIAGIRSLGRHLHVFGSNVTPADVYFGRDKAILKQRERIKRKTLEARRLHHRQHAA